MGRETQLLWPALRFFCPGRSRTLRAQPRVWDSRCCRMEALGVSQCLCHCQNSEDKGAASEGVPLHQADRALTPLFAHLLLYCLKFVSTWSRNSCWASLGTAVEIGKGGRPGWLLGMLSWICPAVIQLAWITDQAQEWPSFTKYFKKQ